MLHQHLAQSFAESLLQKSVPDDDGEAEETPPPPPARSNNRPAPAVFTAGRRRRRIARDSARPRSGTAPHLTSESQQSGCVVELSPTFATRYPVMDTPTKGALDPTFNPSPTVTPTADGKKKSYGLFDKFKSKECNEKEDATKMVPTSLFPDDALKSPKALRFLDVPGAAESFAQGLGSYEDGNVFGVGRSQAQTLSPMGPVGEQSDLGGGVTAERQTKFKEEDIGDSTISDATASSTSNLRFWKKDPSKKALKNQVLDLITPSLGASRPKTAGRETESSSQDEDWQDNGVGYHSDGDLAPQPRRLRSDELANRGKRRQKKKYPKALQRMTPISEGASPLLQNDYTYHSAGEDDDVELDLISEYGRSSRAGTRPGTVPMTRSLTMSVIPRIEITGPEAQGYEELHDEPYGRQYEVPSSLLVRQNRLEDRYAVRKVVAKEEEKYKQQVDSASFMAKRPVHNVFGERSASNFFDQAPPVLAPQSSLQEMERVLLTNTEERTKMDAEKDRLEKEHHKLKSDFDNLKHRSLIPFCNKCNHPLGSDHEHNTGVQEANGDKDIDGHSDAGSIEYGTDEEIEICTAKPISVMRVTPGMVKMVDIPPRKKAVPAQAPQQSQQNQSLGVAKAKYKLRPKHPSYYKNQAKWEPLAPAPVGGGEEHGVAPPVPPKDPKRGSGRKGEGKGGRT
ncbi:uncharacterized protein EI97DRAFT_455008 [Westerdykella ornata]|uniref:Uncharacterized protein n=1 Tax=Westerdykella ornata TaxID=318751 RepID=A0A6A6JU28_WESOR|nr:uncharacterized protein EI97DRAFT_455008 [Westerdykella ornata]KAF2280082.1 hypothetical protein EI97DRAFT_455008 [Westerdykella ornata]